MIGNLLGLLPPLLLLALVAAGGARAFSEEENLAYIEQMLGYLNNNYECTLPTFAEVDEMQRCFVELERDWGAAFEARLSADQRLVRRTLLEHWDAFQATMSSPVIVRSAKKRPFLCKIEDYQEAKFGSSVCTRIKDIKGPITNHIFEKNPIVRYLKHLETGVVAERPMEPVKSTTTTTEAPTTLEVLTATEQPTTATEDPATSAEEPATVGTAEDEREASVEHEGTAGADAAGAPKSEGESARARDEHEQEGVQHTYIGKFAIDFEQMPERLTIEFERQESKRDARAATDNERDPLDDIPVPRSDDRDDDEDADNADEKRAIAHDETADATEAPTSTAVSTTSTTSTTTASTTTKAAMFDEHGAEYIEEEYDDAQLERLVRAPKKDWQFDPIYGYFKWPDECNEQLRPSDEQLDETMLTLDGVWAQFLADPYAYDAYLESIKPTTTTTQRPRINAGLLRQQKRLFDQSIRDDSRRGQIFGWNNERASEKITLYMPEIKRDRWKQLADNSFCKLAYNTDYLKNKGKRGVRKVKSLFTSASAPDATAARASLLASPCLASI